MRAPSVWRSKAGRHTLRVVSEPRPALTFDAFIGKHGDAWRLYVAEESHCPPELRAKLDARLEAVLLTQPDLADLERHMWANDAPYQKRDVKRGGVELAAQGRSAAHLAEWLLKVLGG